MCPIGCAPSPVFPPQCDPRCVPPRCPPPPPIPVRSRSARLRACAAPAPSARGGRTQWRRRRRPGQDEGPDRGAACCEWGAPAVAGGCGQRLCQCSGTARCRLGPPLGGAGGRRAPSGGGAVGEAGRGGGWSGLSVPSRRGCVGAGAGSPGCALPPPRGPPRFSPAPGGCSNQAGGGSRGRFPGRPYLEWLLGGAGGGASRLKVISAGKKINRNVYGDRRRAGSVRRGRCGGRMPRGQRGPARAVPVPPRRRPPPPAPLCTHFAFSSSWRC